MTFEQPGLHPPHNPAVQPPFGKPDVVGLAALGVRLARKGHILPFSRSHRNHCADGLSAEAVSLGTQTAGDDLSQLNLVISDSHCIGSDAADSHVRGLIQLTEEGQVGSVGGSGGDDGVGSGVHDSVSYVGMMDGCVYCFDTQYIKKIVSRAKLALKVETESEVGGIEGGERGGHSNHAFITFFKKFFINFS